MLEDAKNQSENIKAKSADLRNSVRTEFEALNTTVTKLLSEINELSGESVRMANNARDLVDEGLDLVTDEDEA